VRAVSAENFSLTGENLKPRYIQLRPHSRNKFDDLRYQGKVFSGGGVAASRSCYVEPEKTFQNQSTITEEIRCRCTGANSQHFSFAAAEKDETIWSIASTMAHVAWILRSGAEASRRANIAWTSWRVHAGLYTPGSFPPFHICFGSLTDSVTGSSR
jgi:hypothetical protein